MGYLNEDGLARYDGLIKQWVTFKSGTVDGIDPLLNWQKTTTASTVSFYPLPAAPLDPVVTFTFTETGPAEGEKLPTNPSTITGVSSITVTRCETEGVDETQYIVDLGGAFYGGSVDLSAGTMTVTHTAIRIGDISGFTYISDFDGCWAPASTLQPGASYTENPVCTHAIFTSGADFSSETDGVFRWSAGGTNKTWWYFKSTATTAEEFYAEYGDAYLAFKLQVPQTLPLTSTQIYSLSQSDPYTPRINTIYSDQTSVQVGYPKSPQATATELTNAIISLGGNV